MEKKYKHLKLLGKGGNGLVWKVVDGNKNIYAKKILKRTDDAKAYSRFKDEVEIIKQNPHSGIIPLIESFLPRKMTQKKFPFYIMPLGTPLKEYMKNLSLQETFNTIIKLIETLEFLHNKNITHRDLKIENIIVIDGEAKISDFGLANFPKQNRVSVPDEKIGPAFTIAPEMKRISSTAEYKKADVYSLAKTIWVILTKQWLSFDGQYNSFSSISLKNHVDIKINIMRVIGVTHYFSIVVLEQLLVRATHNDPEVRPTISEFKEEFLFWLKSNTNYELRNSIEWNDAIKKIFPVSVPESSYWDNPEQILKVLEIIFSEYDNLNHSFFPNHGGLDFKQVRKISYNGATYLLINEWYLFKPSKLHFEFMSNINWCYFRLEVESSNPIFNEDVDKNEETIFVDKDDLFFPEHAKDRTKIDFFLKGSFLIVHKTSNINRLRGQFDHYEGLHNSMPNNEYKIYLEKIKKQLASL